MTLQNGTAIDVASAFLRERVIFLAGAIDDSLANKVVSQILLLAADSDSDITVYINSPGGSVSAGLAVFDTIQHVPCDVRTIGIGMCASMGAFLLCSGTPGKRAVLPNTQVLIHQPIGGASGQATDIAIAAQHILEARERINRIMAERTGNSQEAISRDMERDHWMWGAEAVEYGVADRVIEPACLC